MAALPKNRKKMDNAELDQEKSIVDDMDKADDLSTVSIQTKEDSNNSRDAKPPQKPLETKIEEAFTIVNKLEKNNPEEEKTASISKPKDTKKESADVFASQNISLEKNGVHISVKMDTPDFLLDQPQFSKKNNPPLLDVNFTIAYPWTNPIVKDIIENLPKDFAQGLNSLIKSGFKNFK